MKVSVQAKRIGTRAQTERALDAIVAQAGGEVALAAMNLTSGEEVARNAERSMPTASVFKLPLLVEVFRQAEEGALDLDERVTLGAEDVVMGSGILRDFGPGLQPTLRDLAMMMVIVSDNSATNLLLDRVGGPRQVNATMSELGLPSIVVHRRIMFGEITTNGSLAEAAPRDLMRLVADAGTRGVGLPGCLARDARHPGPAALSRAGAPLHRLSALRGRLRAAAADQRSTTRQGLSTACVRTPV